MSFSPPGSLVFVVVDDSPADSGADQGPAPRFQLFLLTKSLLSPRLGEMTEKFLFSYTVAELSPVPSLIRELIEISLF